MRFSPYIEKRIDELTDKDYDKYSKLLSHPDWFKKYIDQLTEEEITKLESNPDLFQKYVDSLFEGYLEASQSDDLSYGDIDEYADNEEEDNLSYSENPIPEDTEYSYYGIGIRPLPDNQYQFVSFEKKTQQPRWGKTHEVTSMVCECLIRKYFCRFLYPLLKPNERIVLEFIVDRTFGWGKQRETIRKSHFTKGLRNVTGGTGLSEPTINKALKSLCSKNILHTKETYTGCVQYRISIPDINIMLSRMGKGIKRYKPQKVDQT